MIYDCVIIGAGPAGISASIQLSRAGLQILLLEKNAIGGLLRSANLVENYLGYDSLSGPELIAEFKKNLDQFSVPMLFDEVLEIKKNGTFRVKTRKGEVRAKTVLVATGTQPLTLGASEKKALTGKKIFYELADFLLAFEENVIEKEKVLIVGGGDVGFDYALTLHEKGFRSVLITRGKIATIPPILRRAKKRAIPIFENTTVESMALDGIGAVLVAIGRQSLQPKIHMQKPLKGLYFAGDTGHQSIRQSQIAAGEGLMAAMQIIQEIKHANCKRNRK